MKITEVISCVFLLLGFLISCKEKSTNPPDQTQQAEFPNSAGSRWTYFFYDSLRMRSDTVKVLIDGSTILPNGASAMIWRFQSASSTDTQYVRVNSDTVEIYDIAKLLSIRYLFPLSVGKGWRTYARYKIGDSIYVADRGTVTTPAGDFQNAYRLQRNWGGLNDYGASSGWLVPKVGIVKLHNRQWGFSFANETWTLLAYFIIQ